MKVGGMLVRIAGLTQPVSTVDEDLDHLASANLFPDSKDCWRANARDGKTCPASQVKQLTARLAGSLPQP